MARYTIYWSLCHWTVRAIGVIDFVSDLPHAHLVIGDMAEG